MNRTEEKQGTENDPVLVVQEVQQLICPSQCSDQGQCKNGTCLCNSGNAQIQSYHPSRISLKVIKY